MASTQPVRGEGTSREFSFDRAFLAAKEDLLNKRPPPPGTPDYLFECRVVEIGARIGGIAGLNEMYVIVE